MSTITQLPRRCKQCNTARDVELFPYTGRGNERSQVCHWCRPIVTEAEIDWFVEESRAFRGERT